MEEASRKLNSRRIFVEQCEKSGRERLDMRFSFRF